MDGDVQTSEPDRVAGGAEPAGVSELGQDRDSNQLPDAELAHQRLAPSLAASERPQFFVQRHDLAVQRIDHAQRDRDLRARRG